MWHMLLQCLVLCMRRVSLIQAEVKYSKPGLCMSHWEQDTHTAAEQD